MKIYKDYIKIYKNVTIFIDLFKSHFVIGFQGPLYYGTKIFGRFVHIVTYVSINLFMHENRNKNSLGLIGWVQGVSADRPSSNVAKKLIFSPIFEFVDYFYL